LEAIDTAFPDVPGGDEIRFTYPQGDDAFHLGDDVEKAADA
jgi:hypothetical protein